MLVVLLLPKIAWAGSLTGTVMKVGNWLWSTLTSLLTPAEPWMWAFVVGIFWILIVTKAIRQYVGHWVTYLVIPPFQPFVLIPVLLSYLPLPLPIISSIAKAGKWWRDIMNKKLPGKKDPLTIGELTVGALGCAALAGICGGKALTAKPLWLWGVFVPAGVIGIIMMILFIAEKVGGEKAKAWVKNAPKGSVMGLWRLIRFGKKKPAEGEQPPAAPTAEADQPTLRDQRNWVNCPTCGHQNPPNYAICGNCETASAPATISQTISQPPANIEKALDMLWRKR
ncbi:zinc ribbon domain-containing protein [Patescibacteria group bacterium]|nr:zinc ribbon domain-containing protein [Patescibacteria group bacterium]